MPRFYNLVLTSQTTGKIAKRQDGSPYIWGTNVGKNAAYDAGATEIEFDVVVSNYAEPTGGHGITLFGIALPDLLQAAAFAGTEPNNGGLIATLSGGMSAGLPLANPKQAGVLMQGQIVQSWGNWVGTDMTLDFVVSPSTYTPDNPGNIVMNWKAGTPLSQAIAVCLKTAYPGVKQNIAISPKLVLHHDEVGYFPTLEALAKSIMTITEDWGLTPTYAGVFISYEGGQLYVYDNTVTPPSNPVQLQSQDLVGQPTWIGPNEMQFSCVMRADLHLSSLVTMPKYVNDKGKVVSSPNAPSFVTTAAASTPNGLKYDTTFKGTFVITRVRHTGRLRATDGQSWISIFNCMPYGGPAPSSPS